ncbi:MAG: 2OG-Fe(II) oxygenase [Verrucomicrobiota bacterium]|nr:2OG-Fe(II) oxygenase [Verrucomicrobiota bacterium]
MRIFLFLLFLTNICAEYTVQTLSTSPRIYYIENFLSEKECNHLINLATPHLQPSTVIDDHTAHKGKLDARRTSQGMFILDHIKDKTVLRIEKRIAALTQIPIENGESIQVLQYKQGAEYQPHFDYFNPATPGGASHLNRGGQRLASLIMYLNTPASGGETIFPSAKVSVSPKKGGAVLFYNCSPEGEVDPKSLHGGAPVKDGEKWIATKWLRQHEFH